MKFKNYTKIINIVLAVLITLTASFSLFFSIKEMLTKKEHVSAATYISTPAQLKAFSKAVSDGNDYSGETVYLSCDIDMKDARFDPIGVVWHSSSSDSNKKYYNCKPFNGTFNGQGHTISNFYIQIDGVGGIVIEAYIGFFCRLNNDAVVKNLKLSNFDINTDHLGVDSIVGCLVGNAWHGAKISNCIIENGSVSNLNALNRNKNTSGIVGVLGDALKNKTVEISNCLLNNVKGLECFIGPAYSSFAHKISVSYCVAIKTSGEMTYDDGNGASYSNIYTDKDSAINALNSGDLSSSYWYKPVTDEFNDGWPYLSSFINWKTYYFDTNGDSASDQTKNVPDGGSYTVEGVGSTARTVALYGSSFTANDRTNEGYNFKGWVKVRDYFYQSTYEKIKCSVTFNIANNAEMYVNDTKYTSAYNVTVDWNTSISYSENLKENWYKYVIDGYATIIYYPTKTYTINSKDLSVTNIKENLTVTPTFQLKQYGSVWL